MTSLLSFIAVIGICVVVHEYGHYISARLLDVQIHEFAFGMGPVLFQRTGRTTVWSVRAFPVGGFVRLAGMGEEAEGEVVEQGRGFYDKAPWKRFLILFNGALFNVFLATVLTVFFLAGHGVVDLGSATIGELMDGYPAQAAGLVPGDRVLSVNGTAVTTWNDMSESIRTEALKGPVTFIVQRRAEKISYIVVIPRDGASGVPLLGVRPAMRRYTPGEALRSAFSHTVATSAEMLRGIVRWITGAEKADITGPLGIAAMAGQAASRGLWTFISFLSLINLNLGLINLLPFPALDGGRLFFTLGEMILRRRLPPKLENYIHISGFVLLIALILYVTWQDVLRLI